MVGPGTSLLRIPDSQRGRQAIASLGGYAYQIFRSIREWLRLRGDSTLLVEVAEDYAVLLRNLETLEMTQVKNDAASGSVTLRGDGPTKAINSFWEHQEVNSELQVRLIYLTTARAGREKGIILPGGLGGIAYWNHAAAGADVEPLRAVLVTLPLGSDVLEFIREASADELRDRLLRRISWAYDSDDLAATRRALEDRLIGIAADRHLLANDGISALAALFDQVMMSAVAGNRELTRADFERAFEAATSVPMSRSAIRQTLTGDTRSSDAAFETNLVDTLSSGALPRRLARRDPLVEQLADNLAGSGVLWLHGSSGLGKSLLARLIVARSNRRWRLVELRTCNIAESERRLRGALSATDAPDFGGLVIDDLSLSQTAALRPRLETLAREVADANGRLVITSERAPYPLVQRSLEPLSLFPREAPYLTREDVADIIEAAGGESERWAEIIYLTCGFGHPQLVDARIAGLASREWPPQEQLSGLLQKDGPNEVTAVRQEVTLRLIDELSSDAHELLLRLSIVAGPFDRALALAVAAGEPSIARAGVQFDYLVGPWIEIKGTDRFSVSPLVGQSGVAGLGPEATAAIHRRIVDHLVTRRPYPADFLNTLLTHSLLSHHFNGLSFIASAIMLSKEQEYISPHLSLLPFLASSDGIRLVPEYPSLSALLRIGQLIVVTNEPGHSQLEQTVAAALGEFDTLPTELADDMRLTALHVVLGSMQVDAGPYFWMPLLRLYKTLITNHGHDVYTGVDTLTMLDLKGLTVDQFFFAVRTSKISTVSDLEILFNILDTVDSEDRHTLLASSEILFGGPPLFVQAAWANEQLSDEFDARREVLRYSKMIDLVRNWDEPSILIECICSQVVLLDEYVHDRAAALALLDAADARYPGHARLVRARSTVLANAGRHSEALTTLGSIAAEYATNEPIERALMLRSAAISAAHVGDLDQAAIHFREARDAADTVQIWAQGPRIGLLVDLAVIHVLRADRLAALETMLTALIESDLLDPSSSDGAWFSLNMVTQALNWMTARARGRKIEPNFELLPGICSRLATTAPVGRQLQFPRHFGWYLAARLEAEWSLDLGISDRLFKIEINDGVIPEQSVAVRTALLDRAIRCRDLDYFFTELPTFTSVLVFTLTRLSSGPSDLTDLLAAPVPTIEPECWSHSHLGIARGMVSAFAAHAILSNDDLLGREIAERAETLTTNLSGLRLDTTLNSISQNDPYIIALMALRWIRDADTPEPNSLVAAMCHVFVWLRGIPTSEPRTAVRILFVNRWLEIIENRSFLLTMPRLAISAIEAAATEHSDELASIAVLIEAAALGSTIRLSTEMNDMIAAAKNK